MKIRPLKSAKYPIDSWASVPFILKWLGLSVGVGAMAGIASAVLLFSLEWARDTREGNTWIIWLLPAAGFLVGASYHYFGKDVVKGNNQLLEEYFRPKKIIRWTMAPLVLFGTVMTHLFGGSAGREGTAVQMSGSLADQLTWVFKLRPRDRKILIVMGVSAGFASVFGTPLAGTVFALEVFIIGRMRYESLLPSLLAAVVADFICTQVGHLPFLHLSHTHYLMVTPPALDWNHIPWALLVGLASGLVAMAFSHGSHFWGSQFKKRVAYAPLRPVFGGVVIAAVVFLIGTTDYIGLGVPYIEKAFTGPLNWYDFAAKLLFTTFTLGAGFKGGEVTPLFFIGATLGNALALFVPLPLDLLAGMGFVAVFAGATNTPIACTIMGMELFGVECGVFVALACFTAYLFSGHSGIYSAQIVGTPKHLMWGRRKGRSLGDL